MSEEAAQDKPKIDKEVLKKAFKAFKKRLKVYQEDTGSSAPASHLSRDMGTITAINPPNQWPKEVWEALAEKGKLKLVGRNLYEIAKQ